eukprot:TRINITY_DN82684_c0_g1_i1.p1 TRINITY_DN82684_c0_g1~~TRINITY_DN82684_c0_g1_i1.p1  ORF type:complete len:324 (+),score=78.53 TRINITY_DN82684_c0_g1_i1:26-997(+)
MAEVNMLADAQKIWEKVGTELEAKDGDELKDGVLISAEEIKKVGKWLQQTVTKFGASAAVAEGEEIEKALKPIGQEVIKAYTAASGTLLSMRRGAGASLIKELQSIGKDLTEGIDSLGASVGKPSMSNAAGKVLERVKHFDRLSLHNRAAVRRRLLKSLATLRDANREMQEEISENQVDVEDSSDPESDFPHATVSPSERRLVESILSLSTQLEEVLKEASSLCMPKEGSDSTSSPSLQELEAAALHGESVTKAVDALATDSVSGIDFESCRKSLDIFREAAVGLSAPYITAMSSSAVDAGLTAIQEALDSAEAEDENVEDAD